jgi:hypothetical protein
MPTKSVSSKLDYKKEFPDLYNPKQKEIHILTIPTMQFYMVDGKGDPNTAQMFKDAVSTLYACAFTLKMGYKKQHPTKDYVVPPLEGLWFMEDMREWSSEKKNMWQWTMMIRIPDYISVSDAQKAIQTAKLKKNPPLIEQTRIVTYEEGTAVQVIYIGPYSEEHPIIMKMHEYAAKQGYKLKGKHHEIYLSDPRKITPEKYRTIIRQPITKN